MSGDRSRRRRRLKSETGTTLIETAIACGILLVTMAGLMGMAAMATSITENQGHLSARTTEYAVDKMEHHWQEEQKRYDKETGHGTDPATQNAWAKKVRAALSAGLP